MEVLNVSFGPKVRISTSGFIAMGSECSVVYC